MEDPKSLSNEESLRIITQMIQTAKGNLKGSSFYFLLWGWVGTLGNLGHFLLIQFSDIEYPSAIWLITVPAWIISLLYGYRQSAKEKVRTYSDTLIAWLWMGFSVCAVILIFSGRFNELIPATILMIAGLATFMTGLILKYKPLVYGGSSFWVFSAMALHVEPVYGLLISAVAIVVGYLIPGYILRSTI